VIFIIISKIKERRKHFVSLIYVVPDTDGSSIEFSELGLRVLWGNVPWTSSNPIKNQKCLIKMNRFL